MIGLRTQEEVWTIKKFADEQKVRYQTLIDTEQFRCN